MSAPPVDEAVLHERLRREVGTFREHQRSRVRFDPTLHVGTPGREGPSLRFPAGLVGETDRLVRAELFAAVLEEAGPDASHAWVRRPGSPQVWHHDVWWLVGAAEAFGAAGRDLAGFHAITRHGWVDVRTGENRVWKRLRITR